MSIRLKVQDLDKVYGEGERAVHAVRGVSFETEPGEFVAIVGPSGSGKTTMLAMIGGLLTPTRGSIEVNGQDIARLKGKELAEYRRRKVGFVFQANNLLPYLTARENLLVMARINGTDLKTAGARADQLLEELGLAARRNALATELSGGERQRVAIARALMNDPELVLVDEPTASLDSARGRQVVESLIAEVKGRDKLGLMVTHDMAMAALADRVLEMHDGQLVAHTVGARG
ncbi:ABC transporter ATP-binding protein [Tepidiforma thermophila]|uniref:Putative hemin import ATP-binding protein HrtA n=1 Tax=Tepidiforma thermophila (strain KCTC 52669 / CGMCC 1.13589 / G233) TaxID=2761530 RepID=A0A2A9HGC7_TEPT2|nr:ABC transporter ATP-binding protein [Tepidiforma thermophila]PFG74192.1 putative ABC transport system ATP-binding protein [Tepidiforma thermophila]